MPQDGIQFRTPPSDWGIKRMMDRIEYIQERFGPKIPLPRYAGEGDFQKELENKYVCEDSKYNVWNACIVEGF